VVPPNEASGMSGVTGLGFLDLSILEACERVGAKPTAPYVKTARVLDAVWEQTGIGRRTAHEPLCDLARPWVSHLALVDFHGNYGSPDFGPAAPRYTECRLTRLGAAALAAERGEIGPLPIGLINGDTHVDGLLPPLDPHRTLRALRAANEANDVEIVSMIGLPAFPTGCVVAGDIHAFGSGAFTELTLTAHITELSSAQLMVSHLPPGVSASELCARLAHKRKLVRSVNDASVGEDTRLVIEGARGAQIDEVRAVLTNMWGVRRPLAVRLGRPIADSIRAFTDTSASDLTTQLDLIAAAVRRGSNQ
jgi:DNA gyrase subunit A